MRTFALSKITCGRCSESPAIESFRTPCQACGYGHYNLEINRSTWGVDLGNLVELSALQLIFGDGGVLLAAAKEGVDAINPCYRTKSLLEVSDIPGTELLAFLASSIDDRREMYVRWKRREIEGHLQEGQKTCVRCGVVFVSFRNAWNTDGFCSRTCSRVAAKSGLGPGSV